ncbi:hypothetical protein KIW84_032502 [Lathyrus oleraceus]|uniref:Uncharacterized protein n=1 Tax=Pisum sativum TaxID=3888 RepID=A0A9D5B1S5_PEA|nr:hypothetical protein KIW84_032502 [Pisum sativum]
MTYTQFLPYLIQNGIVVPRGLPPMPKPYKPWYNENVMCAFHDNWSRSVKEPDVTNIVGASGVTLSGKVVSPENNSEKNDVFVKFNFCIRLGYRKDVDSDNHHDVGRQVSDDDVSVEKPVSQLVLHLLRKECSLPFPRRVFAPWLAGTYVCDYLQPSETVEVLKDHLPSYSETHLVENKLKLDGRGESSSNKSAKSGQIGVVAADLILLLSVLIEPATAMQEDEPQNLIHLLCSKQTELNVESLRNNNNFIIKLNRSATATSTARSTAFITKQSPRRQGRFAGHRLIFITFFRTNKPSLQITNIPTMDFAANLTVILRPSPIQHRICLRRLTLHQPPNRSQPPVEITHKPLTAAP